jgi:predicted amidohydrolase
MALTVAAIQMRAEPGQMSANVEKARRLVVQASDAGARRILLPELFNVGYHIGAKLFEWWEPDDGPTVTWMREEARARDAIVAGSIAERRGGRLLNTMFIAEPDGALHKYAKRQPTKNEIAAFDGGQDPSIIETSLGRLGVAVCADMTWGASLLRPLAGKIDLMLVPQASNAPRWQGRLVWRLEQRLQRPLFAGHALSRRAARHRRPDRPDAADLARLRQLPLRRHLGDGRARPPARQRAVR